MGELVVRANDKRLEAVPRIHSMVARRLRLPLLNPYRRRFAGLFDSRLNQRISFPVVYHPKLDISWATENPECRGLYQVQIITLDPELVDRIWYLESKRYFVRLD